MPFVKGGEIPGNRFKKGESGNPNGKALGKKNRATISREIFEMVGILPTEVFDRMKKVYPGIEKNMSVEKIIDIVQASKAITAGDTQAAKYLKDNVYGSPKSELELNTNTVIQIKIE